MADKTITSITLNRNSNLNRIRAAQIDLNQVMLGGQTETTHITDRVSKLKYRQFPKFSTYNVRTLLRPGRLHKITTGCKIFNIDVVAIQEHRCWKNEEKTPINSNGYQFIYSTATERSQGWVGLLITDKTAKNFLHIKNISSRILLDTINWNPKIAIICTYAPTEEDSATDKDTFYNNLTDCIRAVPLHNFVVLLGDLNDRIGPSNAHLKTVGRYPTIKKPMTMVID